MVTTRPAATAVTAWSEPVGGLVARIEQAGSTMGVGYESPAVFVRLRNVGGRRLIVPTFADPWDGSSFRVETWSNGRWEVAVLANRGGTPVQPYLIEPGDDVLCGLPLYTPDDVRRGDAVRVTLEVPPDGDGLWTGTVTTPARPVYVPPAEAERLAGTVPMPRIVPSLQYRQPLPMGNESGEEPACRRFRWANQALVDQMRLYPDSEVVGWLRRQLDVATDPQWQLFLTGELAAHGNTAGRAADPTTIETTRIDPDPQKVDLLVLTVRYDRDAQFVMKAISQLSKCRTKAAVCGLIDCYGSDLNRNDSWKMVGTADDLRDRITAALRELTGRPFGWDAAEWRAWWEHDGKADPRFR